MKLQHPKAAQTPDKTQRRRVSADATALSLSGDIRHKFWAKVEKTSTCWLFRGAIKNGYGRFYHKNKFLRAHRMALIWHNNCAPKKGLVTRHRCRNRNCVNPRHLEWGTLKQNLQDKFRDKTTKPWAHCGERHFWSKLKDEDANAIIYLYYSEKKSMSEIARRFNCSRINISNIVRGRAWADVTEKERAKYPSKFKISHYGERGSNAKLTQKQVASIPRLFKDGQTKTQIGKAFGVSRVCIANVLNGKSWGGTKQTPPWKATQS